jgi:hypothetical protein
VGTNPRVRVQQDDAYILWDKIAFDEDPIVSGTNGASIPSSTAPSPEWVRRTICCAQWETEHADTALPRVVLATLVPQQSYHATAAPAGDAPQQHEPATTSPVPLPAPHHAQQHRHEPRVTGTLVTYWARRARLAILEVPPSPAAAATVDDRASSDDRRSAHNHHHHHHHHPHHHRGRSSRGGMVERPPAVKTMMEVVAQPSRVVRVLARGEKLDPDP